MANTTANCNARVFDADALAATDRVPRKYIGDIGRIRADSRFDEARLDRYLQKVIPDYRGPLGVSQFEGGQANSTYMLTTPNARYVLRRKPGGKILKSAHAVDREFRVITALAAVPGIPVPEALVLCEDEGVIGSMFYARARTHG